MKRKKDTQLSIIVPIFNVVFDLDACLASTLRQGLKTDDYEVIMVNDGSTDGSLALAEKWHNRYDNFQLINQKNSGLSAARNTGIKKAKGTYIIFLDSDDIVPDGAYKHMLNTLQRTGSDFITGQAYRFSKRNRKIRTVERVADLYRQSKERLNIFDNPEYIRDTTPWNKMYNRKFFLSTGVMFPEGRIYEDVATSPKLYYLAKSFDVCKEAVYYWRVSPGSITKTVNPAKALDRLWGINLILDYFEKQKAPKPILDQYDFTIIDYNLRWIFLDLWQYDEKLQIDILTKINKILTKIDTEVIKKVDSPVREWALLAKNNNIPKLRSVLGNKKINVLNYAPDTKPKINLRNYVKSLIKKNKKQINKNLKKNLKRAKNVFIYKIYRKAVLLLPINNRTVVFSSYWGQKFSTSDGPAILCIELSKMSRNYKCIVFADDKHKIKKSVKELVDASDKIKVVKNNSLGYFYYLWTAKYLFNDVNFLLGYRKKYYIGKRAGQVEVQTTHGVPLKKMGLDSDGAIPQKDLEQFIKKSKRYDYLVSTSKSVAEQFSKSHGVYPKILKTGLPQNDFLFKTYDEKYKQTIKKKYGLSNSKKIVVYAPTFRYGKGYAFRYLIDFERLKQTLSEDYQLVIKTHPFNHTNLNYIDFKNLTNYYNNTPSDKETFIKIFGEIRYNSSFKDVKDDEESINEPNIRNVWGIESDINDLLIASDALITDYSSTMFNYIHLDKPMIFYTPDIEHYSATRGIYYDIDKIAPGCVAKNTEELIEALQLAGDKKTWNQNYTKKVKTFKDKFVKWEKGEAANKILKEIGII